MLDLACRSLLRTVWARLRLSAAGGLRSSNQRACVNRPATVGLYLNFITTSLTHLTVHPQSDASRSHWSSGRGLSTLTAPREKRASYTAAILLICSRCGTVWTERAWCICRYRTMCLEKVAVADTHASYRLASLVRVGRVVLQTHHAGMH
jgi:hypothetical protein